MKKMLGDYTIREIAIACKNHGTKDCHECPFFGLCDLVFGDKLPSNFIEGEKIISDLEVEVAD